MKKKLILKGYEVQRKLPVNIEPEDLYLFQHELKVKLPDVYILSEDNLLIENGCRVLNSSGKILPEYSEIYYNSNELFEKIKYFFKKFIKKNLKGEYFWVIDSWSQGYFHWLMDVLPRLYCLYKEFGSGKLLLPEDYRKYEFINSSIRILNFEPIFYSNHSLSVEKLSTCTYLAQTGIYNPEIIRLLRDMIIERLSISKSFKADNIYISRSKATKRKVLNEIEVVTLLKEYGFSIICLEDLNFYEQVLLLEGAHNVVSIHGAGLANCMFMQPGKNVLELRRKGDTINNAYFSLCNAVSLNYFYLECMGDNANTNICNLNVDIKNLEFTIIQMNGTKKNLANKKLPLN